MATKIFMEALSPTMEEGRLVKWLKNEGDRIAGGDVLAEVETDKAVMELVARGEGVLRKRLVSEGDTAPVGTLVGVIAGEDEDIAALVEGAGGGAAKAAEKKEEPKGGDRGEEKGATTPKPSPEEQPEREGGRKKTSVPEDAGEAQGEASTPPQEKAPKGGPMGRVPQVSGGDREAEGGGNGKAQEGRQRSSPLARRLASERGVDMGSIQGSGPGGRIIKRDIEAAESQPAAAKGGAARRERTGADYEDVALTQIRKTIARRLGESIGPIPTFYLTAELELDRVAEMREAMAAMGDEFKVSYNDIIMKAVATALTQHPECNAHWLGDRIRLHNRVHLGMAVATDDGLIVPVIFDADRKSLREIGAESRELAKKARARKLRPEEFTGSTFSVSNLGMFGIDQFTAIINPPEVGILAIGAVEEKPVIDEEGELSASQRLRVTMSCDHRVVDGAVGAAFLRTLRRMLENPLMLVY